MESSRGGLKATRCTIVAFLLRTKSNTLGAISVYLGVRGLPSDCWPGCRRHRPENVRVQPMLDAIDRRRPRAPTGIGLAEGRSEQRRQRRIIDENTPGSCAE
jgi:hypothetical protein